MHIPCLEGDREAGKDRFGIFHLIAGFEHRDAIVELPKHRNGRQREFISREWIVAGNGCRKEARANDSVCIGCGGSKQGNTEKAGAKPRAPSSSLCHFPSATVAPMQL